MSYMPALDGLRAVAVAAVVAFHLGRLSGGFLGVDVFFVVSGFLITRLLLAEHERSGVIALGAFWRRRFRRLLPALCVMLVAVMAASRAALEGWRLTEIRTDALAALAYVANWRFIRSGQSYFTEGTVSPLRHTWSLSIEEQFYLVWPLIVIGAVALGRRSGRARGAVAAVAGLLGLVSAGWMALVASGGEALTRAYYGTGTRAFALCAGAVLAALWEPAARRRGDGATRLQPAAIVAGGASAVVVAVGFGLASEVSEAMYRGGFQAFALVATVLVASVAAGGGPIASVLSTRPLVWLGRRSYGIYLWTWPVQVIASEGFDVTGAGLDATVLVVGLGLATASYWLVEEPIRTGSRPSWHRPDAPRVGPRTVTEFAWGRNVAAVALVAVLIVVAAVGTPEPPGYLRATDAQVLGAALAGDPRDAAARAASSKGTTSSTSPATVTTTVAGQGLPPGPFAPTAPLMVPPGASSDPASVHGRPMEVLVLGDSVAWSVGWQIEDDVPPSVVLSDRAIIGCGILPVDGHFLVGDADPQPYSALCAEQARAEQLGLDGRPDVMVLWIGAWEVYDQVIGSRTFRVGDDGYAAIVEQRIQERLDRFRSVDTPALLVKVPCFGPGRRTLGTERTDPERVAWVNERLVAVAERNRGWVRMVDPTEVLCEPDGTPRAKNEDGLVLRADGTHFAEASAIWFWDSWLAGQIGAAFDPT